MNTSVKVATCRQDGEPLILTFEMSKKEFLCMVCGAWYGYFEPTPAEYTDELNTRYEELKAKYIAGERP